jgi:glycosyltransferase involved in cell wall biosynthesis
VSEDRTAGPGRQPRIAVLWDALSGYFHAELTALVDAGAQVMVFHRTALNDAPFAADRTMQKVEVQEWQEAPDERLLVDILEEFRPDALLVISWHVGGYRRAARRWRGRALRILCMDNQWWGRPKQWGGVLSSRWLIRPTYDVAFVAGERQAEFARRLGLPAERLIWGMYTGDYPRYAAVAAGRSGALPPEAFLYVGRLVPDKAIDVLAEGYRRYRATVADPWPLVVAGAGPDGHHLDGVAGVDRHGFVQPHDLPALFAEAGCLVLPSRFEPWGVVIHEAAAAGLPVVCTRVCGASTRLVLDGYNGVVISSDSPDALASGLSRISESTEDQCRAMGEGSSALALQYSPERWAANLLRRIGELRGQARGPRLAPHLAQRG